MEKIEIVLDAGIIMIARDSPIVKANRVLTISILVVTARALAAVGVRELPSQRFKRQSFGFSEAVATCSFLVWVDLSNGAIGGYLVGEAAPPALVASAAGEWRACVDQHPVRLDFEAVVLPLVDDGKSETEADPRVR